jgi:hypothetical protein
METILPPPATSTLHPLVIPDALFPSIGIYSDEWHEKQSARLERLDADRREVAPTKKEKREKFLLQVGEKHL